MFVCPNVHCGGVFCRRGVPLSRFSVPDVFRCSVSRCSVAVSYDDLCEHVIWGTTGID